MPPAPPPPAPETGSDGHLIGVDVGGTKVAVATLEDEALSSPTVQATDATSADGLVDEIVAAVEAARNPRTQALGVGVPSVVDFLSGHVRSSVNLHMEDFDLRGVLLSGGRRPGLVAGGARGLLIRSQDRLVVVLRIVEVV